MRRHNCLLLALTLNVLGALNFAIAETTLVGYNTSGQVYEVNTASGALTLKAQEDIHSFSLGAIARKKATVYYVAAPSGATENSIYTVDTSSGSISHVDLDRSDDDDEVVNLFFNARKLYGMFFNSSTGSLAIYQINPATGATTLKLDLSSLDIEPVAGSLTRIAKQIYFLAKPSSNSARRQLVRFRVNSSSIKIVEVQTKGGSPTPVLCDRIKLIRKSIKLMCLASTSATQVDTYRLTTEGRASYLSTLNGIERIAGGHTMVTPNEKNFYAFVYATGESNSQRLVKINSKGLLQANVAISTIIVGARFGAEESIEQ
jgi:6-phosphogluconolactonase (cycloisomerase 2 family)